MRDFARRTFFFAVALSATTVVSGLSACGLRDESPQQLAFESARETSAPLDDGPSAEPKFDISEAAKGLECESGFLSIGRADYPEVGEATPEPNRKTPQSIGDDFAADKRVTPDRKSDEPPPAAKRVVYDTGSEKTAQRAKVEIVDTDGKIKGVVIVQKLGKIGWVPIQNASCSATAPGRLELVPPGDDAFGNRVAPE